MTHEELMKLSIEKLEEVELFNGSIRFDFILNGIQMRMNTHLIKENLFAIGSVFHHHKIDGECPLCGMGSMQKCSVLEECREEFFQRLIAFPHIRLGWVYRSYMKP